MLNTIKKFFIKNMSLSVKIAVFLLLTGFSINNVFADTDIIPSKVYAVMQNTLGAKKSGLKIDLVAAKECELENITIKDGDSIKVSLSEYVQPKRGKRNGYYKVKLISVNITQINGAYYGTMRIAEPKDTAEVLKKAGTTVAGVALGVPGLSQGIAVAKGLISPNDNESRMQSAGKNLYESTPLPLVNKGIDFYAPQDSLVVLSLKKK